MTVESPETSEGGLSDRRAARDGGTAGQGPGIQPNADLGDQLTFEAEDDRARQSHQRASGPAPLAGVAAHRRVRQWHRLLEVEARLRELAEGLLGELPERAPPFNRSAVF